MRTYTIKVLEQDDGDVRLRFSTDEGHTINLKDGSPGILVVRAMIVAAQDVAERGSTIKASVTRKDGTKKRRNITVPS